MIDIPQVDWLLQLTPRPAQLEAISRAYYGVAVRDAREGLPRARLVRPDRGATPGPATGWGHFLEMRVGKTPVLLNEFELFRRDHGLQRLLVFAPNKYKHTWATETQKFGVAIETFVFESDRRSAFKKWMNMNPRGGAVFVNYEAAVYPDNLKLIEEFIGPGTRDNKTLMAADESVFIKNHTGIVAKNVLLLGRDAKVVRALSGKPTPQSVGDLYMQLRFIRELEGWNYFQFRNRFAFIGGFRGKQILGVKNTEQLDRIKFACSWFARRADWGTAIPSDYELVKLDMSPRQAEAYKQMDDEFMMWLDSGEPVTADQIITKHQKQQQISSGFIIDAEKKVHWLLPFNKTPKYIDLLDRLKNYINGKVLLVFHYTATGDALIEHLRNEHFNIAIIRGGQYMDKFHLNSEVEKHRFNTDPECTIMVAQEKAVKYGHTLMGTEADPCLTTIFFENTYSLDDRAQVEERNQGEGQQSAISIIDYWTSPVERAVIRALQRKEQVAAKIMGYYKGTDRDDVGD